MSLDLKGEFPRNPVSANNDHSSDVARAIFRKEQQPCNVSDANETTKQQYREVDQHKAGNILTPQITGGK
jgi:hypothetical protein